MTAQQKSDRPERGDGMDVIEHANCIPRDRHDRLIDKATEVIEAGERRMYEAMKERDEARQQLRGAVDALQEIAAHTAGFEPSWPAERARAALRAMGVEPSTAGGQ